MSGVLLFCVDQDEVKSVPSAVVYMTPVMYVTSIGYACKALKAGKFVVAGPEFCFGWPAPRNTIIAFTQEFLRRYPVGSEVWAQASNRCGNGGI